MVFRKSALDRLMLYILFHQRWIFVLFILPASLLYDLFLHVFNFVTGTATLSTFHKHTESVANVRKQVKEWKEKETHLKLNPSPPGLFNYLMPLSFRTRSAKPITLSMSEIIEINQNRRIVRVEPYVTVEQLSSKLLPMGWTLPVLPELGDLTISTMINEMALESSSNVFGLFKDTCVSFDIVTTDGELRHCSEIENRDLFYSIPASHGTLGILVGAEIKIIPAKEFIKLEYFPTYCLEETVRILSESSRSDSFDFVEAVLYSETKAVIVRGRFQDPAPGDKVNRWWNHWWKPWFYSYLSKFLRNGRHVEFVPTKEYYRRHSRSFFWMMKDIIPFGNHWLFRFLFGWSAPPKLELLKYTMTPSMTRFYENTRMVQDMLVPVNVLERTLTYVFKNVKVFPLWLCPVKYFNKPGFVHPWTGKEETYVNIGTYGKVGISDYHPIECTQAYETFVRRVRGHQMLYAHSYQTKSEFSQMFDRSLYDMLRNKLANCTKAFPDVYEKTMQRSSIF